MRIVIHLSSFYDWEPLPDGIEPTEQDINALRVKVGQDGKWLMRVTKTPEVPTYTTIGMSEDDIISVMIRAKVRENRILTRAEAIAMNLSGVVMPHNAHRSWFQKVEVEDDPMTPEHEVFVRAKLLPHVACGHIEQEDYEEMIAGYMTPMTSSDHVAHLHAHFKVKTKVPERQSPARREPKEETEQ